MASIDADEAIRRALREVGLPADYAAEIRARLDAPDESWRSCCGGFCDPCVLTLGRAVDRARALLQQ
ncbi:MAG: hypothetical protein M3Y87_19545 [Myxococcota bacterium]|nr:hypothetical protein [Myxococcota bacterium]